VGERRLRVNESDLEGHEWAQEEVVLLRVSKWLRVDRGQLPWPHERTSAPAKIAQFCPIGQCRHAQCRWCTCVSWRRCVRGDGSMCDVVGILRDLTLASRLAAHCDDWLTLTAHTHTTHQITPNVRREQSRAPQPLILRHISTTTTAIAIAILFLFLLLYLIRRMRRSTRQDEAGT
jgi:hypothetical protein